MAKTRAQRKAEKRRREAQLEREGKVVDGGQAEARSQRDTRTGVSGEVAEAEAVLETGARTEDYGEHTVEHEVPPAPSQSPVPGVLPETPAPEPPAPEQAPEAPAP